LALRTSGLASQPALSLDAEVAVGRRAVQAHRGAERAAGHLERADQARHQGARPAAVEATPAVVDGLAERDGHRAVGKFTALDLGGLADARVVDELQRQAPDDLVRHVADAPGPQRRIPGGVVNQLLERRLHLLHAVLPGVVVGTDLDARDLERALERRVAVRRVERHRALALQAVDQRLAGRRVAQEEAVWRDQVG
jgi:hypothetical protein